MPVEIDVAAPDVALAVFVDEALLVDGVAVPAQTGVVARFEV